MFRRVLVPTMASLGVHALLLVLAGTVTLGLLHAAEEPRREVAVDLAFAPTESQEAQAEAEAVAAPAAARAPSAVPVPEAPAPVSFEVPRVAPVPARPVEAPRREAAPALKRPLSAGRASFAGVRADEVQDVVYVVDASGSMASSLTFVTRELQNSLARLDPGQRFAVLAFADRAAIEADAPPVWTFSVELVEATPANVARAASWMAGLRPMGRSDPLPALEAALRLKPDVVFLLTRSIPRTEQNRWGEGIDATLKRLDDLNPRGDSGRRRTLIKSVQFIDDDPTGLLQAIAIEHAGGPGGYALRTLEQMGAVAEGPEPTLRLDAEVDRAAALLGELLESGDDTAVLVGLGDETMRRSVQAASKRAFELLSAGAQREDPFAQLLLARSAIALAACEQGEGRAAAIAKAQEAIGRMGATDATLRWTRDLERARLALLTGQSPPEIGAAPKSVDWRLAFDASVVAVASSSAAELPGRIDSGRGILQGREGQEHRGVMLARVGAKRARALAEDGSLPERVRNQMWRLAAELLADAAEASSVDGVAGSREALLESLWWEGLGREAPLQELLPEVSLALAKGWMRDDAARAEAIARELLGREDAAHVAAESTRLLAQALSASPLIQKRTLATATLLDAADLAGDPEQRAHWRQAALHLARDAEQAASEAKVRLHTLEAYERALRRVLVHEELEHRAFWASEYPRVALALAEVHRDGRALELLERIDPSAPQTARARALYQEVATAQADELVRAYEDAAGEPSLRDDAIGVFESAAVRMERAGQFMATRGDAASAWAWKWRLGRFVQRELPDRGASVMAEVLASGWTSPRGREVMTLETAEALLRAGKRAEAFALLRPIAEGRSGPRDGADAAYWRAWTMMLEVLEAENDAGQRTGAIRAHLLRLKGLDQELGGPSTRERLLAVEARLE